MHPVIKREIGRAIGLVVIFVCAGLAGWQIVATIDAVFAPTQVEVVSGTHHN